VRNPTEPPPNLDGDPGRTARATTGLTPEESEDLTMARNSERRPWPGRRRENHVKPGYQACTFSVSQVI
jgi:hypothetical protein